MAWTSSAWVLIPIFAILAGVATTWIRVTHGYPPHGGRAGRFHRRWHSADRGDAADEVQTLRGELKKKDAEVASLEERVRVLERIVTDSAAKLRDEIDSLK